MSGEAPGPGRLSGTGHSASSGSSSSPWGVVAAVAAGVVVATAYLARRRRRDRADATTASPAGQQPTSAPCRRSSAAHGMCEAACASIVAALHDREPRASVEGLVGAVLPLMREERVRRARWHHGCAFNLPRPAPSRAYVSMCLS